MGIEQHLPPHPALSPGERENLRTLRQHSGNVGFDPTHRSSAPRQPDKTCTIERPGALGPFRRAECSPSPLRRGERIPPKMAKNRNLARQSRLLRLLRKELLSRTSSPKVWFNHEKVCPSSIILLVRHGNMRSCSFKSRCSFRLAARGTPGKNPRRTSYSTAGI